MKGKRKAVVDIESLEMPEIEEYELDEIKLHVSIKKKR